LVVFFEGLTRSGLLQIVFIVSGTKVSRFYARKQLLLSAHLSHRNSVCLSVRLSVCHTGGSVKDGAS